MINPLTDWLGDGGKPVQTSVAEYRATICKRCPMNVAPNWWEEKLKDPIAEAIRIGLELKSGMNLHLKDEDKLSMCRACGCCIRLKVWTPIEHILSHFQKDDIEKFHSDCWVIKNQK